MRWEVHWLHDAHALPADGLYRRPAVRYIALDVQLSSPPLEGSQVRVRAGGSAEVDLSAQYAVSRDFVVVPYLAGPHDTVIGSGIRF